MAVVLITGCSSGFGLQAALAFARNGDRVVATMRDLSRRGALDAAAQAEALSIELVRLDVTAPESFADAVADVVRKQGRLDVLINNAGINRIGAFEDTSEATLREVLEVNLFGPLLLVQAVLPVMRRQGGGCIINLSSLSGVAGLPGDVSYTASKFALEGATEALRHEVDRWGIRVALVEAGLHATDIFADTLRGPLPIPAESPYRPLIEQRMTQLGARMADAFDPRPVGELLVEIAESDSAALRWPADAVAKRIMATLFAQGDAARDAFLREVAGSDWWSRGEPAAG
ncbi:MAG: SDR family oxidoreductase [Gammaproteobacteria bacterium]|nr:SDR family oxidoreductase [Gammaproteobacteria bacterium]MYE50236.1 SDR family oxidoreductase [Gammaproteobacteria bacterium]MYF09499.1 SDR family oxidoreductase [Gammaproteobacteria bacterium]MYF49124.1 SDR family oxidoreductase [Gammaproteobacteria bacterium]